MTETRATEINGRWTLYLPLHRADRPEWPWFEAARHAAMVECVKQRDPLGGPPRRPVVYDVGAEIGDTAALLSSWGCDVVLCEPNPKAWPWTRVVWEANGLRRPLAMWPGFVGDIGLPVDGGDLYEWPDACETEMDTAHGSSSLDETPAQPVTTLDALSEAVGVDPHIVTIDVEGAELHVLRGARDVLSRARPDLFVSIHPTLAAARYGYGDIVEAIRWLVCEYGYPHSKHTHLATDHEQHWWFRP